MRIKVLTLLFIIFGFVKSFAQINFEKGYFVDEANQKVDCLIRNTDWEDNPTEFFYKFSETGEIKKATIESVKEFGINSGLKYKRTAIQMDRSSNEIGKLDFDKKPIFQQELLFLKSLVEGNITLYSYKQGDLIRFFYEQSNSSTIEQLVYKKYKTSGNEVAENNTYRQQLFLVLKCQSITMKDVEWVKYNERNLTNLFIKYNQCINPASSYVKTNEKKDLFDFTIRLGLSQNSLSTQNNSAPYKGANFAARLNYRVGVESEFILPFKKNKWSIPIELAFRQFKGEESNQTANVIGGVLIAEVDYKSIELPIGLRHYFFLNNNSKIFLNASSIVDFSLNGKMDLIRLDNSILETYEVNPKVNFSVGAGFKHNNRWSMELRYASPREILNGFLGWKTDYKSTSVIFGFTL